jgi:Tol biopolymer transport system component
VYEVRENWRVEIGLREGEGQERKPILQMPALAVNVTNGSLRWSPREHKFIWSMYIAPENSSSEAQVQLWMADATRGKAEIVATLGEVVEYVHPAVWSPDGRYIAALKIEGVQDGKDSANNIYVFDPESGTERQITHFVDWRLSHLTWSPDGQWLAFTASKGEYGEIWVTSLDGTQQYPIAGPTLPDAPFLWLPTKGGK